MNARRSSRGGSAETLRNIRLVLEYDGAAFHGFQRQPGRLTVQEALEKALKKLFGSRHKISSASGRTDSGVHAAHQVVNFKTQSKLPLERVWKGLNHWLPPAVAIREAGEASPEFHARFSARHKTYEYLIWNYPARSPLQALRSWHIPYPLALAPMRRAARFLVGTHDFRSLCAAGTSAEKSGKKQDTVRTIRRLDVVRQGHLIRIRVQADGFLYRMVRNITGLLVEVGRGALPAADVSEILRSRNRRLAPDTAPALGLTLIDVTY